MAEKDTPKQGEKQDNGQQDEVRPDQVVAVVLKQARELQAQKKELFKRVGANRSMLRSLVENGAATNDQAEAIKKLYPPKKKKAEKEEKAAAAA